MTDSASQNDSRWPHRWATLLVCATFPLIWVGGLVTTHDAGMAVPDWPGTYGYNLFAYPWQTWLFGPWDLFIEHGHRLLGATVGILTIGLVVSLFLGDRRRWMKAVGIIALVAVVAQGALGGARVLLDERQVALIHGCFGPAFFGLAAAIWVMTSRGWREVHAQSQASADKLHRLSVMTMGLAYLQLVAGALVRHIPVQASPETFQIFVAFHLLGAAVLTLHALLLLGLVATRFSRQRGLIFPAGLLGGLMVCQLLLGVGTWINKYGWPMGSERFSLAAGHLIEADGLWQSLIVTGHVATGSLILATSVILVLNSFRRVSAVAAAMSVQASWGAATT